MALYRINVADRGIGSDVIATDPATSELLASEFAKLTGRIVPAAHLMAKLTALRKRGQLDKLAAVPAADDVKHTVVRKEMG